MKTMIREGCYVEVSKRALDLVCKWDGERDWQVRCLAVCCRLDSLSSKQRPVNVSAIDNLYER
jgi:hypothetical protein